MDVRTSLKTLCLVALPAIAMVAHANIVDRARIERISIAGLSLQDGAQVAFQRLLAAGYRTDVAAYEAWWEPARSFVKGDPGSPRSSPDGYLEIVLERNGHRLRAIRASLINPRFAR